MTGIEQALAGWISAHRAAGRKVALIGDSGAMADRLAAAGMTTVELAPASLPGSTVDLEDVGLLAWIGGVTRTALDSARGSLALAVAAGVAVAVLIRSGADTGLRPGDAQALAEEIAAVALPIQLVGGALIGADSQAVSWQPPAGDDADETPMHLVVAHLPTVAALQLDLLEEDPGRLLAAAERRLETLHEINARLRRESHAPPGPQGAVLAMEHAELSLRAQLEQSRKAHSDALARLESTRAELDALRLQRAIRQGDGA